MNDEMKRFETSEEIMDALENATHVAEQVCGLMMTAIRQENAQAADDVDDLLKSGKARLVLQADAIGLKLFAIDAQNKPIGGPLLAYHRRGEPTWVN